MPSGNSCPGAGGLRAAFSGFGFAASVSLPPMARWSPGKKTLFDPSTSCVPAVLAAFATVTSTKPPTPIANQLLVVAVPNRAPCADAVRVAVFAISPVIMPTPSVLRGTGQGKPSAFVDVLALLLNASLCTAADADRKRGREVESARMKQAGGSAALKTDVKSARLQLRRAHLELHLLFKLRSTALNPSCVVPPATLEELDESLR